MAYGMLVAAVMTSIMVTGLCFAAGWRKVYVVAPLQFLAALGITSVTGPLSVRDVYAGDAFFLAVLISAAMPVLFIVMRVVVGLLDKPDAGGLAGPVHGPASQRFHP